jgi:hypothetical protein
LTLTETQQSLRKEWYVNAFPEDNCEEVPLAYLDALHPNSFEYGSNSATVEKFLDHFQDLLSGLDYKVVYSGTNVKFTGPVADAFKELNASYPKPVDEYTFNSGILIQDLEDACCKLWPGFWFFDRMRERLYDIFETETRVGNADMTKMITTMKPVMYAILYKDLIGVPVKLTHTTKGNTSYPNPHTFTFTKKQYNALIRNWVKIFKPNYLNFLSYK